MMDGHWCVRALLQYLKRKVEYQKFVLVPDASTSHEKDNHENSYQDNLILKQRARACTTCFLYTDMKANAKLLKPTIILVMDLTEIDQVALTIFRHQPQHNKTRVTPLKSPSVYSQQHHMDILCKQFEELSLNDKEVFIKKPSLTMLLAPIILTPQSTQKMSCLSNALKSATSCLSDFPRSEFDTIIVIGGRGGGMQNDHSMSDSSEVHPTGYDDRIPKTKNRQSCSWNLLISLQNDSSLRRRPSLTHMSANNDSPGSLDIDNIPVIVHLGGNGSVCGSLPTALLTDYAWDDKVVKDYLNESSIPRPIGFDLDLDAIDNGGSSDDGGSDDDDDEMEEDKSVKNPLIRKRNDDITEKRVKREKYNMSDSAGILLGGAMKRCRIDESDCDESDCNESDKKGTKKRSEKRSEESSEEGTEESCEVRKLQSHSDLMKIRNHGSPSSTRRTRDNNCFITEEERPTKRLFRGSSFDRVIPTSSYHTLATVVEGEVLNSDDLVDDTLNFSTLNTTKDLKSSHKNLGSNSAEPGFQVHQTDDEISEGTILRKQVSPKRKLYRAPKCSDMSSMSSLPSLSIPLHTLHVVNANNGISETSIRDEEVDSSQSTPEESPNTSGEESSTDEDVNENLSPRPPIYISSFKTRSATSTTPKQINERGAEDMS